MRVSPLVLCSSHKKHRSGSVLLLTAFLLVVLIGGASFAVDLGYLYLARTQLQAAADAAALAGALGLENGPKAAREQAVDFASYHRAGDREVKIDPDQDIALGFWDEETYTFTPLSAANEVNANSVRVFCRRSVSRGNPIRLFLAKVLGIGTADVSAYAICLAKDGANLPDGFIGLEGAYVSGVGYTDSYDSSIGYDPATAGDEGHIISGGEIELNGEVVVNGDARPGEDDSVVLVGNAEVTGSTDPLTGPVTVPGVDFGDIATNNDNSMIPLTDGGKQAYDGGDDDGPGSLTITSGDTLALPPGRYYFEEVRISGGGILSVSGATDIYLTGDFEITGSSVANPGQIPSDLQIYSTGELVKITGGSDIYGVIYAPDAAIFRAGGAEIYGLAVGLTLGLDNPGGSNGALHYDRALEGQLRGLKTEPKGYLVE